jgi:hypothetical protein
MIVSFRLATVLGLVGALWAPTAGFAAQESRKSLISFRVEGYDKLKDVRSYLDVATQLSTLAETPECIFLSPLAGTKAARQPWAPFDFYTNVLNAEEQAQFKAEGTLGEADIFWKGDNANRNAAKYTADWTHLVTDSFRGSLEFMEKWQERDSFGFLLRFTRGTIDFQSLVKVRTWLENGSCQAEVVGCTDMEVVGGKTQCRPGGWNRHLLEVIAEASISGALADKFYGTIDQKKKTDVAKVHLVYKEFDKDGRLLDQVWKQKVAPP